MYSLPQYANPWIVPAICGFPVNDSIGYPKNSVCWGRAPHVMLSLIPMQKYRSVSIRRLMNEIGFLNSIPASV